MGNEERLLEFEKMGLFDENHQATSQMAACKDCGDEYLISEKEVTFYFNNGLYPPKRCTTCRDVRREDFEKGRARVSKR